MNSCDPGKKETIRCMGCRDKLKPDHIGIVCLQNCAICPKCAKNFVNTVLDEPHRHIPLKCMTCKAEIVSESFERQLNAQQAQRFVLYNLQFNKAASLSADEEINACPFCDYWEINLKGCGRMYYVCKHNKCGKVSCFWCKKLIASQRKNTNANNNAGGEDQKDYEIDASSMERHFECAALSASKQIWDAALDSGMSIPCPECGIAGMKNNACTHMTCNKCQTRWCYVCCLAMKDLNLDAALPASIMAHNVDWQTNEKRCPMWLNSFHEVDARWPTESEDCLAFLHRIRTKRLLKEAIVKIRINGDYRQLCRKYNIENASGFDLTEVRRAEHVLFQRKNSNANNNNNGN